MREVDDNDTRGRKNGRKESASSANGTGPSPGEDGGELQVTATFIIKTTDKPDIYNLFCMDGPTISEYGIAYIGKMKTSKMLKKWFAENESKDCLVSCEFSLSALRNGKSKKCGKSFHPKLV